MVEERVCHGGTDCRQHTPGCSSSNSSWFAKYLLTFANMAMRASLASNGKVTYQILLNAIKSSSGRSRDLLKPAGATGAWRPGSVTLQ